tara:strand:+ start:422 stop:559 length:138 start_codon:yes stop_codon:yes gene_type:complete
MDESLTIEVRFNSAVFSPAEISLLESILPEIIREMLLVEAEREAE